MSRMALSLVALMGGLALCGCNATTTSTPVASVPSAPRATPVAVNLPAGAPCTAELSRYQSVVRADADTGNVNQSVYLQIEEELAHASAACAAGRDGEARGLIQASKARHGYRA